MRIIDKWIIDINKWIIDINKRNPIDINKVDVSAPIVGVTY